MDSISTDQSIRPGIIQACWGTSSSDLYFVGNSGTIVHYDGATFTRIESGTSQDFKDINGQARPGHAPVVLAVGVVGNTTRLWALTSHAAGDTLGWPIARPGLGVWQDGSATYVSGLGIWRVVGRRWQHLLDDGYPYWRVRGTAANNLVGIGTRRIIHWNGV